jgi:hypothetical protein
VFDGQQVEQLTRHNKGVLDVAFSPAGDTLASTGWEGIVCLWPLADEMASDAERLAALETVRAEWQQQEKLVAQERERQAQERQLQAQERQAQEMRAAQERLDQQEQQRQAWLAAGCCEVCGEKLGFFERRANVTRCKQHRAQPAKAVSPSRSRADQLSKASIISYILLGLMLLIVAVRFRLWYVFRTPIFAYMLFGAIVTFILLQLRPWQAWERSPYALIGIIGLLAVTAWLLMLWRLVFSLPYILLGAVLMFLAIQLFRMK